MAPSQDHTSDTFVLRCFGCRRAFPRDFGRSATRRRARGQPWRAQPGAPVDLRRCARPAIQSRRAGRPFRRRRGHRDRPPTHIRVDPMDCRRREHRPKVRPRQRRLLQAGVDELHCTGAGHSRARARDQLFAWLDRQHPQPALQQAARQLSRATADLQNVRSRGEPCYLAGAVDERIRIRRTVAVVRVGDLVEHPAITRINAVDHGRNVRGRDQNSASSSSICSDSASACPIQATIAGWASIVSR